jgi:hypothetical protein
LEIDIPKCALRGLELDDIIFNSGLDGDCGAEKVNNGSHLQWKINYNDCGTIRTVSIVNRYDRFLMQKSFDIVPSFVESFSLSSN